MNSFRFKIFVFYLHLKATGYIFFKTPLHKRLRLSAFVFGLWLLSIFNWHLASTLRSAYFWFRYVDDVIDQDKKHKLDISKFREAKRQLLAQMHKPEAINANFFEQFDWLMLDAYYGCLLFGQDNQKGMMMIFDGLEYDIERSASNKKYCTAAEIREYFDNIDIPSVTMTLQFVDERNITFEDLQSLIDATRTRYNVRDFIKDIKVNFVNIPIEDIKKYAINIGICEQAETLEQALTHEPFKKWFVEQVTYMRRSLEQGKRIVKDRPIRFRTWLTLQYAFIRPCEKHLKIWEALAV